MNQFSDVQQAIANGDKETARQLLRGYINENPDSSEVWYLAAQAAINNKQEEAFLEKAIERDPLHHQAANALHKLQHPQTIPPQFELPQPQQEPTPITEAPNYADFSKRFSAFLIDTLILSILIVPVASLIVFLTDGRVDAASEQDFQLISLLSAGSFIIQAIYYGYCLSYREGQTIGKRLVGIRVTKRDDSALTIWEAVLRSIVGYTLSTIFVGAGFFWMLNSPESQTWHDMVSDTIVVEA